MALHGLRIAWTIEHGTTDPIRRLLAASDDADPTRADITFRVIERDPRDEDPSGWHECFHNHGMRGLERDGELLVLDGDARVRVAADGRHIEVSNQRGAVDEHGFVETTLLIALAIALRQHGLYYLHAGALIDAGHRRILIVGDSGAGKTTTTLALLGPGASVLGDDTVFFAERDGRAQVLAFGRPFHLGPETFASFSSLTAGPIGRRGKRAVPLSAVPAARSESMDAPDIVLFPQISSGSTTYAEPVGAADAFGRVLGATAVLALETERAPIAPQLALLQRLLANARCWELHLGSDALSDPHCISRVVEALA